jgi:hypothetical protein
MARITPLWRSDEITFYRFDHPVEHEDQAYEECSDVFRASFVDEGKFRLETGEQRWNFAAGDVMLSHPGMRFRASFEGKGFNDTCLSIAYHGAANDRFDPARSWAKSGRAMLRQRDLPAARRGGRTLPRAQIPLVRGARACGA